MKSEQAEFWNSLYEFASQGWDIGYPSPAICAYFEQIPDKHSSILIPGAGNSYEAEYLHNNGFTQVFALDFAEIPLKNFATRQPDFPESHLICEDFFLHQGVYDYVVEQTFFSSVPETERARFAKHISKLLKPGGKYVGLLFNHKFEQNTPPFGADEQEYLSIFMPYFEIKTFEIAKNSIKPRAGREIFFIFVNKF